jgi:hypothetical protein
MGILTSRKVTIRRQLVVPSSSNNDDFPLVKHDARVDLNPRWCEDPTLRRQLVVPSSSNDDDFPHPRAYSHVGLTSTDSDTLHCVGAMDWSGAQQSVDS